MKLLLDECIDRKLARELIDYEVKTVSQMGWSGTKNGELLALAEAEFDVFVTVDRHLPFEQNIQKFDIAVIVLQAPSNRLTDLKPLVPNILAVIPTAVKGKATTVRKCAIALKIHARLKKSSMPYLSLDSDNDNRNDRSNFLNPRTKIYFTRTL